MAGHLNKRQILAAGLAGLLPLPAFAADIVRVPIRIYKDRVAVVPVTVNGQGPYPFAFSAGSPLSGIDPDLAQVMGLKHTNQVRNFLLFYGEHDVTCETLRVGGYDAGPWSFSADPLNKVQQARHDKHVNDPDYPRGVIGTPLFLAAPCMIDYEAAELSFYPSGGLDLGGFTALKSNLDKVFISHVQTMTVDASLDGRPLECYLDSAGTAELYLASNYVRYHRLYDHFSDFIEVPVDSDDPSKGTRRVVRMKDFQLGSIHFDEINVMLGDPRPSDMLGENGINAIVGRNLLQQFTLAFKDGQVYAKANASFKSVSSAYVPLPPFD